MARRTNTFILLSLGVVACSSSDPTGPHGSLTSVYVARTVNGVALPTEGNGEAMTTFTLVADTIKVYEDGHAVEVLVTSRPGVPGVARQVQPMQFTYDEGYVAFDVAYPCNDTPAASTASITSCIAPPHHQGVRSSNGMTFTSSAMYRVPVVFERVGPILPE